MVTSRTKQSKGRDIDSPKVNVVLYLADELGVSGVSDVILSDVAVKPVAEIQETIVEGQKDVCDESCKNKHKVKQKHRMFLVTS